MSSSDILGAIPLVSFLSQFSTLKMDSLFYSRHMDNLPPHHDILYRLIQLEAVENYEAWKRAWFDYWEMKYADPPHYDAVCSMCSTFLFLVMRAYIVPGGCTSILPRSC